MDGWTYEVPNVMFTNQYISDVTQNCNDGTSKDMVTYQETNYTFQGLDGVSRPLTIAAGFQDPQHHGCPQARSGSGPSVSNVHGFLATMPNSNTYSSSTPSLTVTNPSGTTYQFGSQGSLTVEQNGMVPPVQSYSAAYTLTPTITDRNGNQIIVNTNSYTDSLGRTPLTWTGPDSSTGSDTITVAGLGKNIKVNWFTPWSVTLNLAPNFVNNPAGLYHKLINYNYDRDQRYRPAQWTDLYFRV